MKSVSGFKVVKRNFGHWDIHTEKGRIRIRGGPSEYCVSDERKGKCTSWVNFCTVGACMMYICDDLMYELIVAEGQEPQMIESWNVGD